MGQLGGGPPSEAELEVSLFGTGRGEALAIHLGEGEWGLIDSCREPASNDPATLAYLEQLGVDSTAVQFIVATHWHDDHIDGIAEMLTACPTAEFACSAAFTGEEFRGVTLEAADLGVSGVDELRRCFEILEARPKSGVVRHTARRVVEDQTVWWRHDEVITLYAVAPTSQALDRANHDVANTLLPTVQRRRAIGRITPNQASVAAVLTIPNDGVLLGGDVEERNSGGSGWSAVIARQRGHVPKSSVFKVPHHGSENAHHDGQWTELLGQTPVSILTAFSSSRLPRRGDLKRILELSRAAYLCGRGAEGHSDLSPSDRRTLREDGVSFTQSRVIGHVRLRKTIGADNDNWNVEFSDGAVQVSPEMCASPNARQQGRRGSGRRGRSR